MTELTQRNVLWILGRLGGEALVEDIAEKGGWSRPKTVCKLKGLRRGAEVKRTSSGRWKITTLGIDRIS